MSINDATPADWDALRDKHPALVKKYEDFVNSPPHYNYGKIECIEAIEESMTPEAFKGYLKGNTMKYLWRYERKGKSVEDLKKAQWYLDKLISEVEE
jgi:hypothetical protein